MGTWWDMASLVELDGGRVGAGREVVIGFGGSSDGGKQGEEENAGWMTIYSRMTHDYDHNPRICYEAYVDEYTGDRIGWAVCFLLRAIWLR